MYNNRETQYFLGSNSARGFYSLYNSLTDPDSKEFLWIIKGGPGCGKSSFMKKIGEAASAAGCDVEFIRCSGDPSSLDAVRIPALGVAYMDGTAPHGTVPSALLTFQTRSSIGI